jgi:uncharacterized protein DUF5658
MFRTAAALTLTLATLTPAYAADRDGEPGINDVIKAVASDTAGETDSTLPPVTFGHQSRGGLLPGLYVSLAALNGFDAYTTSKGLSLGAAESNPMMRALAGNQATLWAVKGGVTAGSIFIAERLWQKHHKGRAIAVMLATNGLMAAVSVRNASILRQQR